MRAAASLTRLRAAIASRSPTAARARATRRGRPRRARRRRARRATPPGGCARRAGSRRVRVSYEMLGRHRGRDVLRAGRGERRLAAPVAAVGAEPLVLRGGRRATRRCRRNPMTTRKPRRRRRAHSSSQSTVAVGTGRRAPVGIVAPAATSSAASAISSGAGTAISAKPSAARPTRTSVHPPRVRSTSRNGRLSSSSFAITTPAVSSIAGNSASEVAIGPMSSGRRDAPPESCT